MIVKRSIRFNILNKNERVYDVDDFIKKLPELEDKIENSVLYGCLSDDVSDDKIHISNISHKIDKIEIKNNVLYVTITPLETFKGKFLKELIDNNAYLTLSPQSIGRIDDDRIVHIDKLMTFNVSVGVEKDAFISVKDIRKMKIEKINNKI
jgi:hypothetical protein